MRRRRCFLNLSLARKLTVLSTATSAVSMAVICVVLGWYDSSGLHARLVSDTEVLIDMVGASSRAALTFGDAQGASQTLRTFGVNEQVAMAAILSPDGQVLARYDSRANAGTNAPVPPIAAEGMRQKRHWYRFLDSRLAMSSPVVLNDEVIGGVYVELTLSELHARLMRQWWSLALALIGTVTLAAAIGWRLQRVISAPIISLTDITRDVTREGNYSVRATKTSDDEIGELVIGFNDMLDGIQQRDARLDSHRQELERIVGARTAELQATMERYKLLVESTHAIPWEIVGLTYVFSYISPQATTLLGYESDVLIDRVSMLDLVHGDDRARVREQFGELSSASGGDLDLEHRVITAHKRIIDVRSVVTAHRNGDGSVVLRGITVDVTRQKKLEMELRQGQKLESVGRLAAGVAHEINTPVQFVSDSVHFVRDAVNDLAGVIGAYQAFHRKVAQGPVSAETIKAVTQVIGDADLGYLLENVPKALERSLDGLNRVATIVRSMKEFAHPDQKEMAPVNLNQAIRSTLTIARTEYKYVADVETDFGELPDVTCHAGDINQVVLNIVVNATHAIEAVVKDTDKRGRIVVRTRRAGDDVEVRISDTGGGIPEEIRDRIFDLFFTTKDVGKGTGQGLAIAQSVIEKHGGALTFVSELDQGTTFTIRLPIHGHRPEGIAA